MMQLGKMQKLVLIVIGVTAKNTGKQYVKRSDITITIGNILHEDTTSLTTKISKSIKTIHEKSLVAKRGKYLRLTLSGTDITRNIIEDIRLKYGSVDWNIINDNYRSNKNVQQINNQEENQ